MLVTDEISDGTPPEGHTHEVWVACATDDQCRGAIVIRSDITHLVLLAYGLTPRTRHVPQRMIAGSRSTAIAAALRMSANTVQDHLKCVFDKVGVRSCGQLVACSESTTRWGRCK